MLYALIFMTGACIGSFINVMLSRKDWFRGRSRCDSCGYTLKWYDMIPIISYVLLRGKCRKCKTKIDSTHFMSELFMGAAFLCGSLSFARNGIQSGAIVFAALLSLAIAAIEDYKEQMVYGFILNGGILVTLIIKCAVVISTDGIIYMIIMIFAVLLLKFTSSVIAFSLKNKIGDGDFDVLIILFILDGWKSLIMSLTIGCGIGCLIYIPQILLKKRTRKEPIPFIPLIFAGTICTVMGGLL